jgi:uncharacterized GH25 family protein
MRKLLLVLPALALAASAAAHDLWLQPAAFSVPAGANIPVSLLIGHGSSRENWGMRSDKVILLRAVSPAGQFTDFLPRVRPNTAAPAISLPFAQPGTHVLAMQSSKTESDLPAARFNDFLKEEGLTPALVHRRRTGALGRPGRELYSRRAKTLIRVGRAPATAATRRLGFTLEIVPERDPYALRAGETLPVRIFYEGKPLAGALVKLFNLAADERPAAARISNGMGRASFNVPRTGKWLVNVIWTKPIAGNPKADFETTFSSLTFGY